MPIPNKGRITNNKLLIFNYNKMSNRTSAIPLTCRTFPPSGKVSKAKGRGVLDESKNTEWVANEIS